MSVTVRRTAPPLQRTRTDLERIEELTTHLRQHHSILTSDIRIARVPLRVCPLGAHIDHQLGVVTGMSIDQSVLLAFVPTDDGSVQVNSLNFPGQIAFQLDDIPPYVRGDWGNYLRGAVQALRARYGLRQGIVGVIESEMPVGGLSSSAAVTIAYLLALETANGLVVDPATNVELVTSTEHNYIGLKNGILDQSAILFGHAQALTRIDCLTRKIDQIPSELTETDYAILTVYSGMTKSLVGTGYNQRVSECQQAAVQLLTAAGQELGDDPRLRHVAPAIFDSYGGQLTPALQRRAAHYFGEMQRVTDGVAAWQAGDLPTLGRLVNASGASSVDNYECGSPQLISLYEILRDQPGVFGARFSGAGFRGSCVALIDPTAQDEIATALHTRYPTSHPEEASRYSIHICRPAPAAGLIEEQL